MRHIIFLSKMLNEAAKTIGLLNQGVAEPALAVKNIRRLIASMDLG